MRYVCEHHTVAIMNAIVIDPSNEVGRVCEQIQHTHTHTHAHTHTHTHTHNHYAISYVSLWCFQIAQGGLTLSTPQQYEDEDVSALKNRSCNQLTSYRLKTWFKKLIASQLQSQLVVWLYVHKFVTFCQLPDSFNGHNNSLILLYPLAITACGHNHCDILILSYIATCTWIILGYNIATLSLDPQLCNQQLCMHICI